MWSRGLSQIYARGIGAGLLLCCAIPTLGDTIYLQPVADTTLMEAFPTNNLGANEFFNAGTTQNYTTNRGLLKFDPRAALNPNARITGVSLTLEVVGNPVDGDNPSTFFLHRVLRDWGEGTKAGHPPQQSGLGKAATRDEATWFARFAFSTNMWGAPGGKAGVDYLPEPSADTFIYGVNFSPYIFASTSNLVADVQYWLEHPEENFGWMLRTEIETDNFSARRFASREDVARAPLLVVDYFEARLHPLQHSNGQLSLSFTAEPGYAYAVEFSQNFQSSGWETLTNLPPSSVRTEWTISPPATHPQCYYRLKVN